MGRRRLAAARGPRRTKAGVHFSVEQQYVTQKITRPWPEQAGLRLQRMLRMLRKFASTIPTCGETHLGPLCWPLHLVFAMMYCLLRQ
jgi:hypothetical protein